MNQSSGKTSSHYLDKACALADHFVEAQSPFGRLDPDKSPFAKPGAFNCGRMHIPPILAETMYQVYNATGNKRYLDSADSYTAFVLGAIRNPVGDGQDWYLESLLGPNPTQARLIEERDQLARSWGLGMALACYADFKSQHPEETCFDSKAEALYQWLQFYRWDHSSGFRVGYARGDFPDNGFTDDLSHVGRGLVKYFLRCNRQVVLDDALTLADYFLTPFQRGSDVGIFSDTLGTWLVGPWPVIGFEHMDNLGADQLGWCFGARDATEWLLELYPLADKPIQQRIADCCINSLKWQFEHCQFDDGAIGIFGQDDKWLGMTAGAAHNYLELENLNLLSEDFKTQFTANFSRACDWTIEHSDATFVLENMGYEKATGKTDPYHPENAGWLINWVIRLLVQMHTHKASNSK